MKSENPPWRCSNFPVPSSPTLQKNRKRKRKLHLYHIIMLCKTCNLISQAQYCYCKPCKSAPADQKVKLWAKWLGKELLGLHGKPLWSRGQSTFFSFYFNSLCYTTLKWSTGSEPYDIEISFIMGPRGDRQMLNRGPGGWWTYVLEIRFICKRRVPELHTSTQAAHQKSFTKGSECVWKVKPLWVKTGPKKKKKRWRKKSRNTCFFSAASDSKLWQGAVQALRIRRTTPLAVVGSLFTLVHPAWALLLHTGQHCLRPPLPHVAFCVQRNALERGQRKGLLAAKAEPLTAIPAI